MMVLKQAKFSGKASRYGKESPTVELTKPIRPMIQSLDSPKLMAKERSKAAFISQLYKSTEPMPREFSSYFLSPKANANPSCLVTSHANPPRTQTPTVSAYPSIVQGLRWNPYVETSNIVDHQDDASEETVEFENSSDHRNCSQYDFTKLPPSGAPCRSVFKDNIMRFSDQCTMTVKVNNACCGSRTPVFCTPKTSEASVNAAVRDTEDTFPLHSYPIPRAYVPAQGYHHARDYPPPILKKPLHNRFTKEYVQFEKSEPIAVSMMAEKEVFDDTCYPVTEYESKPMKKKPCYNGRPGKVLYNEGINDLMLNKPTWPMRIPAPVNVTCDRSRVSVMSKWNDDTQKAIPYSHRSDSKYHSGCMEPVTKRYGENKRGAIPGSRMQWNHHNGEMKKCRICSMPKPVLSSDQDIETYIELNTPKIASPKRKS